MLNRKWPLQGFKWPTPTKIGVLSHVFSTPGVFYYSDANYEGVADYMGVVIVKPAPQDHYVEVGEEGFEPGIISVKAGDRIWYGTFSAKKDKYPISRRIRIILGENRHCASPGTDGEFQLGFNNPFIFITVTFLF